MRKLILERCPHHDILGEEFGLHKGEDTRREEDRGYRWVLDPIDGTKAFITGIYALNACPEATQFTAEIVQHQDATPQLQCIHKYSTIDDGGPL